MKDVADSKILFENHNTKRETKRVVSFFLASIEWKTKHIRKTTCSIRSNFNLKHIIRRSCHIMWKMSVWGVYCVTKACLENSTINRTYNCYFWTEIIIRPPVRSLLQTLPDPLLIMIPRFVYWWYIYMTELVKLRRFSAFTGSNHECQWVNCTP